MRHKKTYVLFIHLGKNQEITIGSLGTLFFKKGVYAYVGSGKRGLMNRIMRHIKREKKKRWHIDYLLEKGEVFFVKLTSLDECEVAKRFMKDVPFVKGFGSSDCYCPSHLFYLGETFKEVLVCSL